MFIVIYTNASLFVRTHIRIRLSQQPAQDLAHRTIGLLQQCNRRSGLGLKTRRRRVLSPNVAVDYQKLVQ